MLVQTQSYVHWLSMYIGHDGANTIILHWLRAMIGENTCTDCHQVETQWVKSWWYSIDSPKKVKLRLPCRLHGDNLMWQSRCFRCKFTGIILYSILKRLRKDFVVKRWHCRWEDCVMCTGALNGVQPQKQVHFYVNIISEIELPIDDLYIQLMWCTGLWNLPSANAWISRNIHFHDYTAIE